MRRIIIVAIAIVLTGCGTARTFVLEPVAQHDKYENVLLVADNPNVEVPSATRERIESVIRKGLYKKGPFKVGNDLEIRYTFISHDGGNRFTRWFLGGIGNSGEGSVAVTVRYLDKDGKQLAKTQVDGRIGSGFF